VCGERVCGKRVCGKGVCGERVCGDRVDKVEERGSDVISGLLST